MKWSNDTGLDSYIVVKADYLMLFEPGGEKAKKILTGSELTEYLDDNKEKIQGTVTGQ